MYSISVIPKTIFFITGLIVKWTSTASNSKARARKRFDIQRMMEKFPAVVRQLEHRSKFYF